MKTEFYKTISPEQLQEYAGYAGLGGENPLDLKVLGKFLKAKTKILEVGCGTGRIGKKLVRKYDYIGIDVHKPYLDYFSKQLQNMKIDPAKHLFLKSFQEFGGAQFDAILFPWSVIVDFDKEEQETALRKSREMLNEKGIVVLDNPAKGTKYNTAAGYNPTKFYFDEWKDEFAELGYSKWIKHEYDTPVGRKRELSVLYK